MVVHVNALTFFSQTITRIQTINKVHAGRYGKKSLYFRKLSLGTQENLMFTFLPYLFIAVDFLDSRECDMQ